MTGIRAVVAGAGLMGRWHAHAAARCGAAVVAFVDPVLSRAAAHAAAHQGSGTYAELEEALAARAADVVHVCTPLATHEDLVGQALAAGCHVLCEKPLAPTAGATQSLLARAVSRERLLCPVHQFLFQRGVVGARRHLWRLGRVLHLDLVACSAGGEGADPTEQDRILAEILPHPLSLVDAFVPGGLEGVAWQRVRPRPGELRAAGRAGGASVDLLVSLAGRPTRNTFRIIGEGGTVHVDLFHGFCVVEPGGVSRSRKVARPFVLASRTLGAAAVNLARRAARREPAYPGLRELVGGFYRAVREGGPPPIAAEETLAVARARDALLVGP